jgi:hypothetical protein
VDELQRDLDEWLEHLNKERPRRGDRNQVRKRYKTFTMGKKEIAKQTEKKEVKKAA